MADKGMYTLLGSVADYLNDNLTDPIATQRVGSYAFGPDFEMNFKKYTPKIQVTDIAKEERFNYGFGNNPRKQNSDIIDVIYFTTRGDVYTENNVKYKDRSLVYLFLEKIEDLLGSATGSITGMHMARFGQVSRIDYNKNNSVYFGMLPITYSYRK